VKAPAKQAKQAVHNEAREAHLADEMPAGGAKEGNAQAPAKSMPRKIIYNADVSLVVKNLDESERELKEIIKTHDGIIANAEISGSSGMRRQGTWKVRVPVDRFDSFLEALPNLGVPERNRRDSEDVSEEYYDLADRIKNKKLLQETLRGYQQEKKFSSKIEEMLAIEKEIERVRTELDQMEGRLRRLTNLTSLTTVTIVLQEIKDYVPPQAPSFTNTISTTFADSVELLEQFGKVVVLIGVALAPWLPILIVIVALFWFAVRRRRRRRAAAERAMTVLPADEPPEK
jgi:hypothetical protein